MPTSHLLAAEAPANKIVAITMQTMPRGTSSLRGLPCLRSMLPPTVDFGPRLSIARSSIPQTAHSFADPAMMPYVSCSTYLFGTGRGFSRVDDCASAPRRNLGRRNYWSRAGFRRREPEHGPSQECLSHVRL